MSSPATLPDNPLALIDPKRGRKRGVRAATWPKFYESLAFMLAAGIPVTSALAEISRNNEDVGLTRHLREVIAALHRGVSLPLAFKKNLPNFPNFHFDLLEMAMETGRLDDTVRYLADYEGANLNSRLQLRASLAYPALQFGVAFLTLSIAPAHFQESFAQTLAFLDRDLPLPVYLFCQYSWFMNYATLFVLALTSTLLIPGVWDRVANLWVQESSRAFRERLAVKAYKFSAYIPGLREAVRAYSQERFTRALGLQLETGRNLVPSLEAAFKITGDPSFLSHLPSVLESISEGKSVCQTLAETGLFDEVLFMSFLTAGEESGAMAELLIKSAKLQAANLKLAYSTALALLNPLLLFVVGALVAVLVLAVFIPLIQLAQSL